MNKLIALAVAAVLSVIASAASATPVTWTFIQTDCTALQGSCGGPTPGTFEPLHLSLTVPGPTSSGTAQWGHFGQRACGFLLCNHPSTRATPSRSRPAMGLP